MNSLSEATASGAIERLPMRSTMRQPVLRAGLSGTLPACAAALALLVVLGAAGCQAVREQWGDYHYRQGMAKLRADRLDAAMREFRKALADSPDNANIHAKVGDIHRKRGEIDQAVVSYESAHRIDPFDYQITITLADLYRLAARVQDAIRTYIHAVDLNPTSFVANQGLGECYWDLGDTEQAVVYLNRAVSLSPDNAEAYIRLADAHNVLGNHYEAIRAYKSALELDAASQPRILVLLGRTYLQQGRLKVARKTLDIALRDSPDNADAHMHMGYCLARLKETAAAEEHFTRAVALNEKLPGAHRGLGIVLMIRYLEDESNGSLRERAVEEWHRSLEINPKQPQVRDWIARYRATEQGSPLLAADQ
jgi:tetratricopeptide (TPR) repeat protein